MIRGQDGDGDIDIVLVSELVGDGTSFVLRFGVSATDDAFEFGPILIVHQGVMKDDETGAAVEEFFEAGFLLFGDVLNHVVENDDIEFIKVGAVVSVRGGHGLDGVIERYFRVITEHLEEGFFFETMATGDDESFDFFGGRFVSGDERRKREECGEESANDGFHGGVVAEAGEERKTRECPDGLKRADSKRVAGKSH